MSQVSAIFFTTVPIYIWTISLLFSFIIVADPGNLCRIPDPISSILDTGSSIDKIPDPGSASKDLSIFNPKKLKGIKFSNKIRDVHPGCRIMALVFFQFLIPDPDLGVKKAPDLGSGYATLSFLNFLCHTYSLQASLLVQSLNMNIYRWPRFFLSLESPPPHQLTLL